MSRSNFLARPIIHLAKIAYSEGKTDVLHAVLPRPSPPPTTRLLPARSLTGRLMKPGQSPHTDGPAPDSTSSPVIVNIPSYSRKVQRSWKVVLSVGIVATVLVSRSAAAFPELTGRQILTQFPDPSVPFSSTMSLRSPTAPSLVS